MPSIDTLPYPFPTLIPPWLQKTKRRRVMSSSDEDEEKEMNRVDTVDGQAALEVRKQANDGGMPDLAPSKKMRRLIMSDDEDD